MYTHHGRFSEELSAATTNEMDELCVTDSSHWSKNVDRGLILVFILILKRLKNK